MTGVKNPLIADTKCKCPKCKRLYTCKTIYTGIMPVMYRYCDGCRDRFIYHNDRYSTDLEMDPYRSAYEPG